MSETALLASCFLRVATCLEGGAGACEAVHAGHRVAKRPSPAPSTPAPACCRAPDRGRQPDRRHPRDAGDAGCVPAVHALHAVHAVHAVGWVGWARCPCTPRLARLPTSSTSSPGPAPPTLADFAAEKNVLCDIETIEIDQVNEAMVSSELKRGECGAGERGTARRTCHMPACHRRGAGQERDAAGLGQPLTRPPLPHCHTASLVRPAALQVRLAKSDVKYR